MASANRVRPLAKGAFGDRDAALGDQLDPLGRGAARVEDLGAGGDRGVDGHAASLSASAAISIMLARTSASASGGQTLLPHLATCAVLVIVSPRASRSMM